MITPSQISAAAHEVQQVAESYFNGVFQDRGYCGSELKAEVESVLKRLFLPSDSAAELDRPGEDDQRYTLLEPNIGEHLDGELLPVLEPSRMVAGRSYLLSPGQRAWLREVYGMTPSATITLCEVATWPGTKHPRRLVIKSDEHIDVRRKHVLSKVVITAVGKFFRESAERDRELLDAKPQRGTVLKVLQKGIVTVTLADRRELTCITTLVLKPNDDVVVKWHSSYDAAAKENIEQWQVTKLLDCRLENLQGRRAKRDSLADLNQLLDELEGKV